MKLYQILGDMTFTVDQINRVRKGLDERASKLPAGDPLAQNLKKASAGADVIRKKIVATKEGGMITGEERLREFLTNLYGSVAFYDGRPSQMQVMRTDALKKELGDVASEFNTWCSSELTGINSQLAQKSLDPVKQLTREEWEKTSSEK